MKDAIEDRLNQNIARVRSLLDIYTTHLTGNGSGRRSHSKTDVLRAAVVLLHASIEDLLRSLAYWRLPVANAETLNKIPLVTAAPATKFTLGQLTAHRGQTVDQVIEASVNGYLERSNYNNTDEITSLLSSIGVNIASVNGWLPNLNVLMSRRHQIVHRADRDETGGRGNHSVRSIGHATVNNWVSDVEGFGRAVLNEIPA